jgi:hypothetical protein
MKKLLTLALFGSMLLLASCAMHFVIGDGNIIKEDRTLKSFSRVSISGIGYVSIHQGDEEHIQIECDENLLPFVKTQVINEELKIRVEDCLLSPSKTIRYKLYVKDIDAIKVSGSADIMIGTLISEDFGLDISGSGNIVMGRLEAKTLEIDISGSGEAKIESGRSTDQVISISGSGDLDLANHETQNSYIKISGSGLATIWVENKLDVKLSGSGDIFYYGDPKIYIKISGSGDVKSLGAK